MNEVEQLIIEYVARFEEQFEGDPKYTKYLEQMRKVDLHPITENEVRSIIQPFLYKWGGMGRVLGRKEYSGWQSKLAIAMQSCAAELNGFKARDLKQAALSELKPDVELCYRTLVEVVGKIAAAKVLHLTCPGFFPAWDNPIADAAIDEDIRDKADIAVVQIPIEHEKHARKLARKLERQQKTQLRQSPVAEYCRFIQGTQNFIIRYGVVVSGLASKHGKGPLKIADECFWSATHMPLLPFF